MSEFLSLKKLTLWKWCGKTSQYAYILRLELGFLMNVTENIFKHSQSFIYQLIKLGEISTDC